MHVDRMRTDRWEFCGGPRFDPVRIRVWRLQAGGQAEFRGGISGDLCCRGVRKVICWDCVISIHSRGEENEDHSQTPAAAEEA